jgi:hypothetical protein
VPNTAESPAGWCPCFTDNTQQSAPHRVIITVSYIAAGILRERFKVRASGRDRRAWNKSGAIAGLNTPQQRSSSGFSTNSAVVVATKSRIMQNTETAARFSGESTKARIRSQQGCLL